MKNFILILTIVALSLSAYGQKQFRHQVITTDGSIYNGNIQSYLSKKIIFYNVIEGLDENSIPINKVAQIRGDNPNYRIRAIKRDNQNVKFSTNLINEANTESIKNLTTSNNLSNNELNSTLAGDYLIKAGNRYLSGIGLTLAGGIVTTLGAQNDNDELIVIGGITALSGAVLSLTGHFQLIKAGKAFNEDITLSLANEGLGFCLNF